MSWREQAAPVIAGVLKEMEGRPEKEVRAALRAAYPFGPRRYHPYKIWIDEVNRQLRGGTRPVRPYPADGSLSDLHDQAVQSFLEERKP